MTFLASLTTGTVSLVMTSASEWQSDVAREITIQVRPVEGRDIEADVAAAARIARGVAGVADVRPYTAGESARLLEPWLGSGIALDDLPVPRLIAVRIDGEPAAGQSPRCGRRSSPRCRTPASTTIAAGSAGCAPWPASPSRAAWRC